MVWGQNEYKPQKVFREEFPATGSYVENTHSIAGYEAGKFFTQNLA